MMKCLFACIIFTSSFTCLAKDYVFSGGDANVAHIIASEVLNKAYARADIKIRPLFLPSQEALDYSNSGITDGEIARIDKITEFAPDLIKIPVSIFSVEAVAFSKNISLDIKSWEDIKGHSLAIVKGTKFIEIATKNLPHKVVLTFDKALKQVKNNKTEIVILPRLAALKIIYENRMYQIKQISPVLKRLELYHFVHKRNQHLIPIISPILKEMKETGEIAFVRSAYLRKITREIEKSNNLIEQ